MTDCDTCYELRLMLIKMTKAKNEAEKQITKMREDPRGGMIQCNPSQQTNRKKELE